MADEENTQVKLRWKGVSALLLMIVEENRFTAVPITNPPYTKLNPGAVMHIRMAFIIDGLRIRPKRVEAKLVTCWFTF